MNNVDKLRLLMTLDTGMNTAEIELRFEQIAKMLFNCFAIQKGNTIYLFKEIEFYFYNKNHRDIITYPRSSKPLCWYNNRFGGVDLNFKSNLECRESKKYNLDDSACFGGILIRQLVCVNEVGNSKVLSGPLKCAELFKHNDTTSSSNEPQLISFDSGMVGYIRRPRINILQPKQIVKDKVNSILNNYHVYPDVEKLCNDFTTFKGKLYRYIRCDKLMHDEETNMVFISPWLKDKNEGHPKFYQRLMDVFNETGIKSKELKCTNDYWARDYMPLQLGKDDFLKYHYYPDYLVNTDYFETITDATKVLRSMGISCRSTNLIIDGGNMVPCGPYIVMTDKVFSENRKKKGDEDFKALLESELGHPVIIIPWTQHKDDEYGHSDGFIKWCGDNRILMGNHGDCYPEEAAAICRILESYGFEVTEMRFKDKVDKPCCDFNWAYINFLQVGKKIVMPIFDIDEDNIAQKYIQDAFPDCSIYPIEMKEIVKEGGALHCITWNVYLP